MSSSFHSADRRTYRKVLLVGLLFCAAFVVISFFTREQPANTYVLKKADRLVRTAGSAVPGSVSADLSSRPFERMSSDCEPVHICSAEGLLNLTALGISGAR
jgi:hypothetical protein